MDAAKGLSSRPTRRGPRTVRAPRGISSPSTSRSWAQRRSTRVSGRAPTLWTRRATSASTRATHPTTRRRCGSTRRTTTTSHAALTTSSARRRAVATTRALWARAAATRCIRATIAGTRATAPTTSSRLRTRRVGLWRLPIATSGATRPRAARASRWSWRLRAGATWSSATARRTSNSPSATMAVARGSLTRGPRTEAGRLSLFASPVRPRAAARESAGWISEHAAWSVVEAAARA
mmetsp:Transcript_75905/g.227845  ORF Transcript_75905/g.227845 Transcript_75905/m.227845 type:complete len:236 (-) Transcript_75905:265-972(-)